MNNPKTPQTPSLLRSAPGYPWLPCPVCGGTESCDHPALERARGAGVNIKPAAKTKQ